jgi:post-segregation antitoxin (ccd killing protein)
MARTSTARTEHVTVTLDRDALADARRQARARKMSLSSLISESLEQTAKYRAFRAWMDHEYRADPITDEEIAAAGRTLDALWEPSAKTRKAIVPARRDRKPRSRKAAKRRRRA